jgi:Putative peptidoglycan binding domain/LysM domain
MGAMAGYYMVKQGDYVSSIAEENGFTDYRILWDHAQNAELKQKRQNPNVLFPGDRLFIPDREERQEACPTDKRHVFKTRKATLRLRLVLEDFLEQPIAGAACDLALPGGTRRLTTDGAGKIDEPIPADTHDAFLLIRGTQTPFQDEQIPVKIGHLDPIDETSGQAARLANLGYYFAPLDPVDKNEFLSAVEEFQCDHGVKVDGKCGPGTQAKLKQVHGC